MEYTKIILYLSDSASEKEVKEILDWIDASPENKSTFIQYKKIWSLSSATFSNDNINLKLIEVQKSIALIKKKRHRNSFLKYAAVFIGLIAAAGLIYLQIGDNNTIDTPIQNQITLELEDGSIKIINEGKNFEIRNKNGLVVGNKELKKINYNKNSKIAKSGKLSYNTLKVPYGKRFEIELSDGTSVFLNAGTSLKYPVEFLKGKSREVFIDGEAYFKVTKNQEDSFIVNGDKLNTQVFGTEFNVSSYANDEKTTIVLVEGSVGVYKNEEQLNSNVYQYIRPNEMASFNKSDNSLLIKEVDVESHIAWMDGVLFFKNELFQNILKKLERHYDVKIQSDNMNLNNQRFTGRFRIENVEEVLNTFSKTNNIKFKKHENIIIINL